jgi:glycosyltransferase involved in cell wall biosynthesis
MAPRVSTIDRRSGEEIISRSITFAISADYARHTGGWVYDHRLTSELAALGWQVSRLTLPAGFPRPDAAQRAETERLISALPDGAILLVDQLVLGVLPELARREGKRLKLAFIVHHPLALEDLRDPDEAERFRASEHAALAHAALIIVPSRATARTLVLHYAVPEARIVVAEPGTDRLAVAPGRRDGLLSLLSIGSVVPRKAHELLVGALAALKDVRWHLTIVGDTDRHPAHVAVVQELICRHGLSDRITLTGGLDQKALEPHWQSANLYVASSRHEGYGMAIAEALSRGIPVVSTDAGAVGEWVDREAVRLVPPDNLVVLREALGSVLKDARVRERMRDAALIARTALPAWSTQASRVDAKLRALISG